MPDQKRVLRVLRQSDLDAIVAIDALATGEPRQEYYERKIAGILNRAANINTSIVCEVGWQGGRLHHGLRVLRRIRHCRQHRHHRHPGRASGLAQFRRRQPRCSTSS
jgi:hypothetical protein